MYHSNQKQHQEEAGFTLIEVALSATVMLFVIAGMISTVTSGAQILDSSNRMVTASNLITHNINELRLEGWDEVSSLPANRTLTLPARFATVADGMSIRRTVVEEETELYRVTFIITWTGITGLEYTKSEDALFAKNGLSATYGY